MVQSHSCYETTVDNVSDKSHIYIRREPLTGATFEWLPKVLSDNPHGIACFLSKDQCTRFSVGTLEPLMTFCSSFVRMVDTSSVVNADTDKENDKKMRQI